MGMDRDKLSARLKQPGHDRTFVTAEESFIAALHAVCDDQYEIIDHPRDLAKIISGRYGVIPEASLTYLPTGRRMYFEVKRQGPGGNADERACKHHTVAFYKLLHEVTGYDYHPFVTVMCESLAKAERYTIKHPAYFEQGHYFCWVDYDLDLLAAFLDDMTARFLAVHAGEPGEQQVPK